MKGTYENSNIRFTVTFDRKEYGEKYKEYIKKRTEKDGKRPNISDWITDYEHLQYEKVDGFLVRDTMDKFFSKRFRVAATDPLTIEASQDNYTTEYIGRKASNCIALTPFIEIPQDEQTFEYAIAQSIMQNFNDMNPQQKRAGLTFLERYVADYEQVRDFAQTGKNFLDGMDPVMGISAQGTAKPKGKR